MSWISWFADHLWDPWLLGLFLVTGMVFMVRSGFFPLFRWRTWVKFTVGELLQNRQKATGKGISPIQALATALGSTIGTGSVAGVATAIWFGGPGAVFWMWVSAVLGMMISCVEKTAAVLYQRKLPNGGRTGGPMEYMAAGLCWKRRSRLFAVLCICATLMGGNLVQSNSIASALYAGTGSNKVVVGTVLMLLTALTVFGGLRRIASLSERLVPLMTVLFLICGLAALICNRAALPGALKLIFHSAFEPAAAVGGCGGYGMLQALRYGFARGVFANEAGVGSSAIAHGAAEVKEPSQQGMWGIFEVFVSTVLICSMTALAILTSGFYSPERVLITLQEGGAAQDLMGAPMALAAFSEALGHGGEAVIIGCLILFAFTSILGWSYYGEQALGCLTKKQWAIPVYRLVFCGAIFVGSVTDVGVIWQAADIGTGLMALVNLPALWCLLPRVMAELERWEQKDRLSSRTH